MICAAMALAALLGAVQDAARIDREKLEWFKKLTPEQKVTLRERLDRFKKMAPEERERLTENLRRWRELPEDARRQIRERMMKLTPEQRRQNAEMAGSFAPGMGPGKFPRMAFFGWLQRERPGEMEKLRDLDPRKRRQEIEKLHGDFRMALVDRLEEHVRRHRCMTPERLERLRKDDWPKVMAELEDFRARHQPNRRERRGR